MEIKELSIGDWVNYKGESFSIDGVNIEMVSQNNRIIGFQEMAVLRIGALKAINVKVRDLTPIPITPEILEKNGFVKESEVGYERFEWRENGSVAITLNRDSFSKSETFVLSTFKIGINGWLLRIEYVHELQHAIRMAGINKEIEV